MSGPDAAGPYILRGFLSGAIAPPSAPLRMTGHIAELASSLLEVEHAFAISRRNSPELCLITPPSYPRGRREGRVLTTHPRSAAQKAHAEEPHSSIQVVPITRPSLRDGRTAYAVLSREPNFPSGLPRPRGIHRHPRRLTRMPPPQELDRSNDGQDHTVLPYARPAMSPAVFPALSTEPETCRRDETWQRRSSARCKGLTESNPPCPWLFAPDAAASTANPAREHDDHTIAPQE